MLTVVRRGVLHTGLWQHKKCYRLRFGGRQREKFGAVLLQAIPFIRFEKKKTGSGH